MSDVPEQEVAIRKIFNAQPVPDLPDVSDVVATTLKQAHVQTGGRNLVVLAISSFFAFLLMIFGPIAAAAASQKKNLHLTHKQK